MQLIKNLFYLSGAEIVSKVVTFVAIAYLARVLGPEGFGYIEFAGAVMLCAGLLVDQGFGLYGAREIAREPARTGALVGEIIVTRLTLAIVAYAAVIAFALWLNRGDAATQLLLIYALSLLPMPLLLQWVFQGHAQMHIVALLQLIRQSLFAGVVFAFVRAASQMWIVGAAEIAGVIGATIIGLWLYRRNFSAYRIEFRITRKLFADGVPIGLSQLFWMVRMFGATVIVGIIATPRDVGFFGGAMRILIALHTFVWLYFFNLLPALSQSWQKRDGAFAALIRQSLFLATWLSVLIGLVWVLGAPMAMTLVYGAAFAPSGVTLQWLAGVGIVAFLSGHYRFGLIATGFQNNEMVAQALGSGLVIVALPIAYAFIGINGAAIVLVLGEVVVWSVTWWWSHTKLGLAWNIQLFARPLIALGLGIGSLWLAPFDALIAQIALIVALIVILAFAMDAEVRRGLGQLKVNKFFARIAARVAPR
ncbi:MAG: oligosaccharide flippase family protein [Chloroflexi bacterium]|nr:oligosaccharide flippase family protein [Chloroflexota bacterium]